jgi:hypothetical protein
MSGNNKMASVKQFHGAARRKPRASVWSPAVVCRFRLRQGIEYRQSTGALGKPRGRNGIDGPLECGGTTPLWMHREDGNIAA